MSTSNLLGYTSSPKRPNHHDPIPKLTPDNIKPKDYVETHGNPVKQRFALQKKALLTRRTGHSVENSEQLAEEFFFPDVSDAIAENNKKNRPDIEHSDEENLIDYIDIDPNDPFYGANPCIPPCNVFVTIRA